MASTTDTDTSAAKTEPKKKEEEEEDQYGQVHLEETPELVSQKLSEFETELDKLSTETLASVRQAQTKCPELLDDKFKLLFLRAEKFDTEKATQRYTKYWDKRIEVMGPDRAFLPLTLDKALKDDGDALELGFCQVIPGVSDPMGRALVWVHPGILVPNQYDRDSVARAFWYTVHAALEGNENAQKYGIVFLGYGADVNFWQFDRKLNKLNTSSLRGAIPVRLSAIHFCRPPALFKILVALLNVLHSQKTKKRLHFHFGSTEKVKAKLETFGLTADMLPKELGGTIELDVKAWLEKQKSEGK